MFQGSISQCLVTFDSIYIFDILSIHAIELRENYLELQPVLVQLLETM